MREGFINKKSLKIFCWITIIINSIATFVLVLLTFAAFFSEQSILGLIMFCLIPILLLVTVILEFQVMGFNVIARKRLLKVYWITVLVILIYAINDALINSRSIFTVLMAGPVPYFLTIFFVAIYFFTRPRVINLMKRNE